MPKKEIVKEDKDKNEELNKYQKKSDREHILDNPDTYIGSVEFVESNEFILTEDRNNIIKKNILVNPGLYKLFDEGIVNCRDHVIRMQQQINEGKENITPVSYIDIGISEDGIITMTNDGNGIDIAEHPEYKLWIPEMIFGHLRTSTNYNKEEKRIIGGKNGFGFKLVLIWSTWGRIETVDHTRGLKYVQEFKDNLLTIEKPTITKCKNKPYTKIQFKPDYNRLQLKDGITSDIYNLLMRRIYDIAAVTDPNIKVKLNSQQIPIKTFQQYVKKIVGSNDMKYESANERWEYAVSLAPEGEFCQISFCNGIYTSKGGKHVDYIINQIIKRLTQYIKDKKKIDVKPSAIKEQLFLFLRCDIENPNYDSQSKEYLNTPSNKFGSSCRVSDDFIEKIAKMGVMSTACQITDIKDNQVAKKTDGSKIKTIRGIPKLIDANYAGTAKSGECILILCEGDSAKAGIVSGLSREDRNLIGIYPMKGKLFNVRGETIQKINDNREIAEIKQILGLEHDKIYTESDVKSSLRYGQILFMTDQDLDGSHIKGLGINIFDSEWRSLLSITNFIGYMNTPILKATHGKEKVNFYNNGEFDEWKKTNDVTKWTIKYYKGLGTSTSSEFKEYFANKKIVYFTNTGDDDLDKIDMVFNKKRSNDRKKWLSEYNREDYLNTSNNIITYQEFINKDLRHFSKYDNDRSIPSIVDGLKISLRKILYAAFKKGLKTEIKVAQFSGYVSEHSGYHHGEASLNGAIIGLAQDFVGTNNINLFVPKGQFGCIDPETPVLLWNGKIDKAKNIKVGDILIGDDGTSRTVSKLTSGIDEMYEIKNGNMDNYVVNSHHILTVYYSDHKSIIWKGSSKSWSMSYFDDNTKTVKYKNIRTDESTSGEHHNKSIISKEDAYRKMLEFCKTILDDNIFDINVQQYLSLPTSVQKRIKGIVNTSVVEWDEQELDIDPYILGLWLGDGMSDCHAFASIDFEIVQSWALWLDKIDCEICHCKSIPPHENHIFYIRRIGSCKDTDNLAIGDPRNNSNNCKGCTTSKYNCKACDWTFEKSNNTINCIGKNVKDNKAINLNPFKELFKKNNLFKNKHIPAKYIKNSEDNRLKILAGMIDTDGTLQCQGQCYRYEISQCKERKDILESFRIIAGSLGFRAKIYTSNTDINILTLSIIGEDLDRIPVKLPRKQINNQIRLKNTHKIHNIEIKSIGQGKFCGWNIDKNERFLLGDFTITHNTRLLGGKDSASERYIFTHLSELTRKIFPESDDKVLEYIEDDGELVEPIFYVPIIPMVLVNGTKGIGTGFSTDIMCYDPLVIINALENILRGNDSNMEFVPYYRGFNGKIAKIENNSKQDNKTCRYIIKGVYEIVNTDIIKITELPIGTWTQDYKEYLESLIFSKDKKEKREPIVKNYIDMSTDETVEFVITLYPGMLDKLMGELHEYNIDGIEKLLKLYSIHSTNNMHLFNNKEQLTKYDTVNDIIKEYYYVRLDYYRKRREFLLEKINQELLEMTNLAKYIQYTLDDKIVLKRKTNQEINKLLEDMSFNKILDKTSGKLSYNYLIKKPMDIVSDENVEKIIKEKTLKEKELNILKSRKVEDIWLEELDDLKTTYQYILNQAVKTEKQVTAQKKRTNKK